MSLPETPRGFLYHRSDNNDNHDTNQIRPHQRLTVVEPEGRMAGSATAVSINLPDSSSCASTQRSIVSGGRARIARRVARFAESTINTMTTIAPPMTDTFSPTSIEKLFFSSTAFELYSGVARATPNRRVSVCTTKPGHLQVPGQEGGGLQTPSPASHHVGVSGGVWNTALTPCWCEQVTGGDPRGS